MYDYVHPKVSVTEGSKTQVLVYVGIKLLLCTGWPLFNLWLLNIIMKIFLSSIKGRL